jgi:hypothetical protein
MTLSRRKAIALVGGGTVVAAGAAAGGFALTRTPHAALAPWRMAGAPAEPRMRALSWALLAPNPHNLQPWVADLRTPGTVTLLADPARRLPQTDPHDRQIAIGLGCFLELMVMAAAQEGRAVSLSLFPEGENPQTLGTAPVAVARFAEGGAAPDPLFAHAPLRRSAKVPFAMDDPPGDDALAAAAAAAAPHARAEATAAPEMAAALSALAWTAWEVEASTPEAHGESVALMRLGRAEIEANPDGIELGGAFLETLMLAGLMTREGLATPGHPAFEAGRDMYRAMIAASPGWLWLATPGNARTDQIAAGRAWLRANLAATALGLGLHPVSQSLQEYPEMAEHRAAAQARLARPGETIQMLGRIGRAPQQPPTPRWPVEAMLRGA